MPTPTEQQILADTLKSQAQGGSAMAGQALGQGANVPAVLEANPATRQLLEEAIKIQSGQNSKSVVSAQQAADLTKKNQETLNNLVAPKPKAEVTTVTSPSPSPQADTTTQVDPYSEFLDQQAKSVESQFSQFASTMSQQAQDVIAGIQETYARRKDQMALLNKSSLAAQSILGARSGRQRYASELQTSILSNEEAAGIQRIADLDREEKSLILQAQMANTEKQFEVLNEKMNKIADLQKEKQGAILDQQKMAMQQEQLLMQKAQNAREQAKFEFDTQKDLVSSLAGTAYSSLTGDPTTDAQVIQDISAQYGIDPNMLQSAVIEYDQQAQTDKLRVAQTYQSIVGNIAEGEAFTDPNSGMTFIGTKKPEDIDVVQTVGNTEYKVRYKMVDGKPEEVFRIEIGPHWKGDGTQKSVTPVNEAFQQAAIDLNKMKQTGDFNDSTYNFYVDTLADTYSMSATDEEKARIKSDLNNYMAKLESNGSEVADTQQQMNTSISGTNSQMEGPKLNLQPTNVSSNVKKNVGQAINTFTSLIEANKQRLAKQSGQRL